MYMYLKSCIKKMSMICLCLFIFIVYVYLDKQWFNKESFEAQNYEYETTYKPFGSSQETTISTGVDYDTIYSTLTTPSTTNFVNNDSAFTYNYIKSNVSLDDAKKDFTYFNNATSIMTGYQNKPSVS